MALINKKWLQEQFELDKTDPGTIRRISTLLKSLERMITDDEAPELVEEVLEKFGKLARGHAIADPLPETVWLSGRARTPGVGQTVRVPLNMYSDRRKTLNGRVGRVVAVRHGDVIVNTTDDGEFLEGVRFRPYELEMKMN